MTQDLNERDRSGRVPEERTPKPARTMAYLVIALLALAIVLLATGAVDLGDPKL